MERPQDRTPVITAIIYSGDRIALVTRSDSVGTYRGKWAGFSGYVERLPLEQAFLEIEEEAGLAKNQVHLKGMGIPVNVDDIGNDSRWIVFPFLFELVSDSDIKINNESSEIRWFTPDEIRQLDTVPQLSSVLNSIWPPFGDSMFWNDLMKIATNKSQGATALARKGLETLGGYVQDNKNIDREELLRAIRAFAASRPVMGAFPDLAARLMLGMDREGGQYDFDVLVTELIGAMSDSTDLSVRNAVEGIQDIDTIFTLSYGEAVRNTIIEWNDEYKSVLIAESSPGKEGLVLAKYLTENGVKVRTVPDSDIENAVRESQAVLVGCDAITENNEIQNKVLTRNAVSAAKDARIPAYAVTQTFKITPSGWPVYIEREPSSVDGLHTPGQQVFDQTPIEWFDAVFTEEGRLTIDRLAEIRDELSSVELIPGT